MGFLKFRNEKLTKEAYKKLKKDYPHIEIAWKYNIVNFKPNESMKAYKKLKKMTK